MIFRKGSKTGSEDRADPEGQSGAAEAPVKKLKKRTKASDTKRVAQAHGLTFLKEDATEERP